LDAVIWAADVNGSDEMAGWPTGTSVPELDDAAGGDDEGRYASRADTSESTTGGLVATGRDG
jgi:hypothetical protein